MQEFRPGPIGLRIRLNPGTTIATLCRYGFGTFLVVVTILGSEAFRITSPAVTAAAPPRPTVASAAYRNSTLSAEVFHKFVSGGQRMYPRLAQEIVESAIKYSEKYNLSPILVLAIASTESEYYPFALSKRNAKGLMQVNPDANLKLLLQQGIFREPTDIFDPERNVEAGCFLLRRFIDESPDLNSALDKYLGAESPSYKAQIHEALGRILLLGITEELNRTAQHKVETVSLVDTRTKDKSKEPRR